MTFPDRMNPTKRGLVLRRAIFVAFCLVPMACGSSPPETYPVSGEVFFDGKPAGGAAIVFHPARKADDLSQAYATVQEDGSFELSTYGTHDGAEAGEYVVTMTWADEERVDGELITRPDRMGGHYSNPKASTFKVTVVAGENVVPRFDLKSMKQKDVGD